VIPRYRQGVISTEKHQLRNGFLVCGPVEKSYQPIDIQVSMDVQDIESGQVVRQKRHCLSGKPEFPPRHAGMKTKSPDLDPVNNFMPGQSGKISREHEHFAPRGLDPPDQPLQVYPMPGEHGRVFHYEHDNPRWMHGRSHIPFHYCPVNFLTNSAASQHEAVNWFP
jgi:hypothetical protein